MTDPLISDDSWFWTAAWVAGHLVVALIGLRLFLRGWRGMRSGDGSLEGSRRIRSSGR